MNNRLIAKVFLLMVIMTLASSTRIYAGEFNSTDFGIGIRWHDQLKRDSSKEKGDTILYVESPGRKQALWELHINAHKPLGADQIFSREFGNNLLAGFKKATNTESFETDERITIGGCPARKFIYKVNHGGRNYWAESVFVAGSRNTFHILAVGDYGKKNDFLNIFDQILNTVSFAGAGSTKPSPDPGGFGDDF